MINGTVECVHIRSMLSFSFSREQEPGDIDSSSLIEKIISIDCVQLKPNLREGIHFQMVPEVLWLFLHKYYRCQGPIVSRKVIYRQKSYPPELDLYPVRNSSREKIRRCPCLSRLVTDQNLSQSNDLSTTNARNWFRHISESIIIEQFCLSITQLCLSDDARYVSNRSDHCRADW